MPLYSYRAVSAAGDVATGEIEAANESEIVDRLRDQGLLPMQIAQSAGVASGAAVARAPGRASSRRAASRATTCSH
jgi:general secretion pathway protein F